MNCKAAYADLLACASPAEPTSAVRQHLADCASCRQRQHRLLRLDRELADLPRPGESPEARGRLLERLERIQPAQPVIVLPGVRPRRARLAALVGAVAASLLLAGSLAYLLGSGSGTSTTAAEAPTPLIPTTPNTLTTTPCEPASALIAALLESNLRLARLTTVPEQAETLADMAGRLQDEALRAAAQGKVEDVAYLGGLHEQLMVRGLAGRAAPLTPDQRQVLAQRLAVKAQEAEIAARQAAPDVRQYLTAISLTSLQTAETLLANRPALPPPGMAAPNPAPARAILGALVLNGVRLAEDDDPLRRADYCTDIADSLVQTIVGAAAAGNEEAAAQLAQHLGEVMDQGVTANLEAAESRPDPPRQTELERVKHKADHASKALERALAKAPEAARAGLQRAIEATNKGKAKGHAGKGKGPPFVPPGLLKKKSKPDRDDD